jgi:glycosyltransferase involved in cell wall biosynthesis
VARGDEVEWFTASFPGSPQTEEIDGVRVVRSGRQWSVHWHAYRHYRGRLKGRFDAVIDEVNTMPFFTPLWAQIPSFMLIFQLAREVWWYESRFPLNAAGYLLEPLYLRLYRHVPALTISASTQADLRRLGFNSSIRVVPIGIEPVPPPTAAKASIATFLYVGRLAPSKRVSHIVQAVARFRDAAGPCRLWLVGEGDAGYRARLESLVHRLGLTGAVEFCGRISPEEKHRRMAEAHLLLMASAREGWGLAVTEANACGTPAVVYDVPGLRDSVRHDATGLVVGCTPSQLASGMLRLWRDAGLYRRLTDEARQWSRTFSYDTTANLIRQALAQPVG